MSRYKQGDKDDVSIAPGTHLTEVDTANPNPNDEICQHCGAGMVDIQEYIGGLGYITFTTCSDIKCRYGIRRDHE